MYRLGLTGGIGSGKTLVCNVLEKLGVKVYYADQAARKLMSSQPELIRQIMELFGKEAYHDGLLNRELLAKIVFGDASMLTKLNAIVHPAVREDFSAWADSQEDTPYVVEEAAILFESGANNYLDGSVLVYAAESIRIQRVMERDGVDEHSVRLRMMHQMEEEQKLKLADHVIYNDGTEMLLPQIIEMHSKIINRK